MRSPTPSSLLALLLLAAGCAHAGPASAERSPRAAPVRLTFAWPDGFRAEVLVRHQSQIRSDPPAGVVARRVLSTIRRDGEIWVATRDIVPMGDGQDLVKALRVRDEVVQVVDARGAFLRAERLDRALPPPNALDEQAREALRHALARDAAEDWEVTVGAWAGQTLEEGRPLHKLFPGAVPLLPMADSLLDVEYGLEGRVPCTPEATERRCVALYYRAQPAASDRAATLDRVLAVTATGDRRTEYFRGTFEVTLITEPDTLVPHRIVSRERLRLRVVLAGGQVREIEETADDEYLFAPDASTGT
jgi:hypothetical protein